ncbi:MAG: DNA polymerase III subunit delta' [Planctomycetota bacterium]|nr:DNA polymerase III subunit delta' [Planctomycetota bacterium]
MIWQHLRGHHDQITKFQRSITRERLSHAYLFVGPSGIGKRTFARRLAQCLLCFNIPDEQLDACGSCVACKQMAAGTHPDFIEIGCPEGKKELPIGLIAGEKESGVRKKEGLCYEMSLRPMEGDRKIAIIDDTELMNDEGANALLKTLEEPPSYGTLFLISASTEGLLPTIRSRCQEVRFAPLSPTDTAELLLELGMVQETAEAESIAVLCEGSLTTAAQLLEPELRNLRNRLYDELAKGRAMNTVRLSAQIAEGLDALVEDLDGTERTAVLRRNALWLIRFSIEFFRQVSLRIAGGRHAPIPQLERFGNGLIGEPEDDLETVMQLFDRCEHAQFHLEQFMQVPLCLDGMFSELARISRRQLARTS